MTTVEFTRGPRVYPEVPSREPVRVPVPPEVPRREEAGWVMHLVPMVGMSGSAVYFFRPGAPPFLRVMGVLMLVSAVSLLLARLVAAWRGTSGELAEERRRYLRRLAVLRERAREAARLQRTAEEYLFPDPGQLWALVAERRRLWERRPAHEDFVQVRIGRGARPLASPIVPPRTAPANELEPLSAHVLHAFVRAHSVLDGLPLAVSLRMQRRITVSGGTEVVYGHIRAVLAQLATLHAPEDLVIAVAAGPDAAPAWEWCKWLPHVQHAGQDGAGTGRLIAEDLGTLEELLAEVLDGRPRFGREAPPVSDCPHLVVVLDGVAVPEGSVLASPAGLQGVTLIEPCPGAASPDTTPHGPPSFRSAPGPRGTARPDLSLHLTPGTPGRLTVLSSDGSARTGLPDRLPAAAAEALARQLAPLRLSAESAGASGASGAEAPLLTEPDLTALLGTDDPATFDPSRVRRPRAPHERLRVPIGVGADGRPVRLDLKEAARGGMGPHGLCVGATGSGKSEVLRTLVLALAVTHPSETLNFVLADFKGGATFAGLASLPHVSAVITNLAGDLPLVDRMQEALSGELRRRQELLRAAGGFASVHDYERAREAGAPLDPLPALLVVLDEFGELLAARPGFLDTFLQIGRIGRSLGVHLLLAAQRLEEGRLRGLDTYLSYRLGLRTFSAAESKAVIGAPDAHRLPPVPGSGYLVHGTEARVRFKAAYVSGPYLPPHTRSAEEERRMVRRPVRFTAGPVPYAVADPPAAGSERAPADPAPAGPALTDPALAGSVLDVIVRRLADEGPPAHRVWLPPLTESPPLDALVDRYGGGGLNVPLGLVDLPHEQRRDVLRADLSGAGGHVVVAGGPRSGKSTLLRTLITSFALTHSPAEAQFYGVDFGGGGLSAVAGLPHVGSVAGRPDTERVRRTVAEVAGVLRAREERAGRRDPGSRRAGPDAPRTGSGTPRTERASRTDPDIFLVIDNWSAFREAHEDLEPQVEEVAVRGLGFGVHLVIAVTRYSDLRPVLKDQLLTRLELRLGDPLDSEVDRRRAGNVPLDRPGRGLSAEGMHTLAALPDDGAVAAAAARWRGPQAPPVRLLPTELSAAELPDPPGDFAGLAFGVGERDLAPVGVDFGSDPFFVVYGDSESGKSNLLRLLAHRIAARRPPHEALLLVADYRRGLLGGLPGSHVLRHAHTPPALEEALGRLTGLLRHRLPDDRTGLAELRSRSWWRGPEVFVLVDDYELVVTPSGNPFGALAELLPYARDIGLRVLVTRASGGAARLAYEPVLLRMKELGAQGVVLSGDPAEGPLLGRVAARRMPPGRGIFVSRRYGDQLVQTARAPVSLAAPRPAPA